MIESIRELANQFLMYDRFSRFGESTEEEYYDFLPEELEEFAETIIYNFLSELTNDDSLGEARIETIGRLARKWGVER